MRTSSAHCNSSSSRTLSPGLGLGDAASPAPLKTGVPATPHGSLHRDARIQREQMFDALRQLMTHGNKGTA